MTSRLLVRLILFLWLLLAGILVFIHQQLFDDGGFHNLIFTDKCPSFCFLGIQPGITTANGARDVLEKQGFVYQWLTPLQQGEAQPDIAEVGLLRWRWSINRPTLLTGTDANLTYDRKTGLVISVGPMGTRLDLGNLLVDLGKPSLGYMSAGINDRDRPAFTYVGGYPQWHFSVTSTIECPMTLRQLWQAPVILEVANNMGENSRFTAYSPYIQPILGYAASEFC